MIRKKNEMRWSRNKHKMQSNEHSKMLTSWWQNLTMIINKKESSQPCGKWQTLEEQACVSHLKMKRVIKTPPLIAMNTKRTIQITRVTTNRGCMISKHLSSKIQVYQSNRRVNRFKTREDVVNKIIIIIEKNISKSKSTIGHYIIYEI